MQMRRFHHDTGKHLLNRVVKVLVPSLDGTSTKGVMVSIPSDLPFAYGRYIQD